MRYRAIITMLFLTLMGCTVDLEAETTNETSQAVSALAGVWSGYVEYLGVQGHAYDHEATITLACDGTGTSTYLYVHLVPVPPAKTVVCEGSLAPREGEPGTYDETSVTSGCHDGIARLLAVKLDGGLAYEWNVASGAEPSAGLLKPVAPAQCP